MEDWKPLAQQAADLRNQMLPFGSQDLPVRAFTDEENAALQAAVDRVMVQVSELEARVKAIRGL